MGERFEILWDWSENGNVAHIAEHDVTVDEVEQVLAHGFDERRVNRSVPARWVVQDLTDHGRDLTVAFELEWLDELGGWLVIPVTAFEPGPQA